MRLGFEGNVCRKKISQRISSHRLEDNIKIVLKNRIGGCGLGSSVSV